jgi:hypothetical protein
VNVDSLVSITTTADWLIRDSNPVFLHIRPGAHSTISTIGTGLRRPVSSFEQPHYLGVNRCMYILHLRAFIACYWMTFNFTFPCKNWECLEVHKPKYVVRLILYVYNAGIKPSCWPEIYTLANISHIGLHSITREIQFVHNSNEPPGPLLILNDITSKTVFTCKLWHQANIMGDTGGSKICVCSKYRHRKAWRWLGQKHTKFKRNSSRSHGLHAHV